MAFLANYAVVSCLASALCVGLVGFFAAARRGREIDEHINWSTVNPVRMGTRMIWNLHKKVKRNSSSLRMDELLMGNEREDTRKQQDNLRICIYNAFCCWYSHAVSWLLLFF